MSSVEVTLQPQRDRMAFLDGLRGATALYVAAYHAYMQLNWRHDGGGLSSRLRFASWIFTGGSYGVVTFIILSGYCLMLPVARTGNGTLRGGAISYLLRRCKRILPPYYAALAMTLLLVWSIPALSIHPACFADAAMPISTGAIISHLLMVHNWFQAWDLRLDPPMWSVAAEFQIYFLFPFLLLPVYRRLGVLAALCIGYALATVILWLGRIDYLQQPQFIGLFCLGMLAADVTAGHGIEVQRLRRLPWQLIALTCFFTAVLLAVHSPVWMQKTNPIPHAVFGVGIAGVFIACGLKLSVGKWVRHLFEMKWLVGLGTFSYSLYLMHMPFEGVIFLPLRHWIGSPDVLLITNLFLGVPTVCLLAYGFYWLFERPLMQTPDIKSQ